MHSQAQQGREMGRKGRRDTNTGQPLGSGRQWRVWWRGKVLDWAEPEPSADKKQSMGRYISGRLWRRQASACGTAVIARESGKEGRPAREGRGLGGGFWGGLQGCSGDRRRITRMHCISPSVDAPATAVSLALPRTGKAPRLCTAGERRRKREYQPHSVPPRRSPIRQVPRFATSVGLPWVRQVRGLP